MSRARPLVCAALLAAAVITLGCSKDKGGPTSPTTRELDSGDMGTGAVYAHRFFAPGSFSYHCVHHSNMRGTVVVTTPAPDSVADVTITGQAFVLSAVAIPVGGKVTWTNLDTGVPHTVTSDP